MKNNEEKLKIEILEQLIHAMQDNSTIKNCKLKVNIDDGGNFLITGKTQSYFQKQIAIHLFQKYVLNNNFDGTLDVAVN